MARILVLGAGFAGLWAAVGAARKLDEIRATGEVEILVVDRNPYHNVRVRNYEIDLNPHSPDDALFCSTRVLILI